MGTWYAASLGDGMTGPLSSAEIQERFRPPFTAAGEPADMAVFTRLESENRLHCEMIAYFSPAAQRIAGEMQASPCSKPMRSGLTLLAGNEAAWSVLFPGNQ